MGGSYELSPRYLRGDLLALLAGLLYAGYLIIVRARPRDARAAARCCSSPALFGAVMLLPFAIGLGEQVWPSDWTPVLLLALGSQVIGQGLLVYALGTSRRWSSGLPC